MTYYVSSGALNPTHWLTRPSDVFSELTVAKDKDI